MPRCCSTSAISTGQLPHVYFGWTEGNPITYLLKFLAFGEGDTAPVTREVLRQSEHEPAASAASPRRLTRRSRMAFQLRSARRWLLIFVAASSMACQSTPAPEKPAPGSGDAAFSTLAEFVLRAYYQRHPSAATDLGIHLYDAVMDDASAQAIADETGELQSFRQKLVDTDPATLTLGRQLDREQLLHSIDAAILYNTTSSRRWRKTPTCTAAA